jgi:hypothetical protein
LPTLPVLAAVEPLFHLATVFGLGPLAALSTLVDRDDGRADAQLLAAEAMIRLAVEGGVSQHAVPRDEYGSPFHGRSKLRSVVTGTRAYRGGGKEMAARVADDRQLRPEPCGLLFAGARKVVAGGVLAIQARSIDGCLRLSVDQAAFLGAHGGRDEEKNGLPFFSSRGRALQSVE